MKGKYVFVKTGEVEFYGARVISEAADTVTVETY